MAIELIPRPAAVWRHQQGDNQQPSSNTQHPAPPPPPGPSRSPEGDADHASLMQQEHSSRRASAEPSHGDEQGTDCQRQRRALLAAMMRHWLRVLQAVLREGPSRTAARDLVEQLMARLDDDRVPNTALPEGGRHCQDGGQTKRRKYLNYFHITRLRLQDLEDEDGTEGVNQHAVIERLRATVRDLRAARAVLEQLTRDQGGQQLLSAHGGLDQAEAAVEHACGEAHNGEFDWMAPGWGAAVCYLIGDAEDLVEEEEGLNLVHPADVLAMAEGAEGATSRPGGTWQQQCQRLLRDVRAVAVMHMQGEPAVMDMLLWSWTTSCYAPSRWTHKPRKRGSRTSRDLSSDQRRHGNHHWGWSNGLAVFPAQTRGTTAKGGPRNRLSGAPRTQSWWRRWKSASASKKKKREQRQRPWTACSRGEIRLKKT